MSHIPEQPTPYIGDRFPEMTVHTTFGELTLPDAYKNYWFVLFSHPGDFTPVCTTEFIAFEQLQRDFQKMNTQLIGLSIDQVPSHMKWVEWIRDHFGIQITFPIIADGLGTIARKLGMIHPTRGTRTVRSVFIVDPKGMIRIILTYPETIGRNIHEIKRAVHALQVSDAMKAGTPANWPNNELTGDKLLLLPPQSLQAADERKAKAQAGQLDCYDWWFCLINHATPIEPEVSIIAITTACESGCVTSSQVL